MKYLILVFGLLLTQLSFAQSSQLSAEQKAAVVKSLLDNGDTQAARRVLNDEYVPKEEKQAMQKTTIDKAKEWAQLGTNLGSALVATSKELGVAANEFAQTPLGKVTTAIIAYKIIGKDLVRTGFAVCIIFLGAILIIKLYPIGAYESVEYEQRSILWGLTSIRAVKSKHMVSGDAAGWVWVGLIASAIIVVLIAHLVMP